MFRNSVLIVAILTLFAHLSGQRTLPTLEDRRDVSVLRNMVFQDVNIEADNLDQFLSVLSLEYGIPIGFESAINESDNQYIFLSLEKGNLEELLKKAFSGNDRYEWQITNGLVRISPKTNQQDAFLRQLLDTKVEQISIVPEMTCQKLVSQLASDSAVIKLLSSRGEKYRQQPVSGFFVQHIGKGIKLNIRDQGLGSILDDVVSRSSLARYWRVGRDQKDGSIFIRVSARHENHAEISRAARHMNDSSPSIR